MIEREEEPAEATYLVTWDYFGTELRDRVTAATPAEAAWQVHNRQHEPDGSSYSVASLDGIERLENITVGDLRAVRQRSCHIRPY